MNEILQFIVEDEKEELVQKEKKKLYYFAHPYSPHKNEEGKIITEECNIMNCIDQVNYLIEKGYNIYAPILMTHQIHKFYPKDYDFWIEYDKLFMDKCDGLILALDWEVSKGCRFEKEYFEKQEKEILYADDLIDDIGGF